MSLLFVLSLFLGSIFVLRWATCNKWLVQYITNATYMRFPSYLGIQFLRRMLLYPVWIYFSRHICQSGCEDRIYCLMASVQDEDCEDDGTQGRPTLPEGTLATERKEEGAPHVATTAGGCRTRKNWACNWKVAKMIRMELVWTADDSSFTPWTERRC